MVLRALLNGQLIHVNKERLGRTVATPEIPEATINPVVRVAGRSRLRGVSQHLRPPIAVADPGFDQFNH